MDALSSALVEEAFRDIQDDMSATRWLLLAYNGYSLTFDSAGDDFSVFKSKFTDTESCVGLLSTNCGTRGVRYCLIRWRGPKAPPLHPAQMIKDADHIKKALRLVDNAVDILVESAEQLDESHISTQVNHQTSTG